MNLLRKINIKLMSRITGAKVEQTVISFPMFEIKANNLLRTQFNPIPKI